MLGLHDIKGISNTSEKMMVLLCLGQGKIVVVVVVFLFKEVREKEGKEEMGSSEERNLRRK